jgi:hypothetical protein
MNPGLEDSVWMMLNSALEVYRDSPRATKWLRHQMRRFEEPLRIAVAGPPKSGKSTLINAIVGEEVAPIEVEDGTQVFTWYQDGPMARATAYSPRGPVPDVSVTRVDRGLHVDVRNWQAKDVNEVVVDLPTRALRHAILIDTPALDAGAAQDAGRTMDQISREADAVLYLMRSVHGMDLGSLRSLQDNAIARATPVNTILVLSRADEVGGGRIDALTSAKQIARRYRRDMKMRALCQNLVAVAGLVAQSGRTLRESEFAVLAALAAKPRAELADFLLSADRFIGEDFPVPLEPEVRGELLERWGIFGVRLASTLIRTGCDTPSKLSSQLTQRSGLAELRESISQFFVGRRHVLKARSALLALDFVLRMEPRPGARRLFAELERTLANAHDFRELRLLASLRTGRTRLPAQLETEAERLIGAQGTGIAARLGIEDPVAESHLRLLGSQALDRWRDLAENPVFSQEQRRAVQIVVRSCEGVLAGLAGPRGAMVG